MSTITKELAKLFRKITNSEIDAEGNAHVVLSPADSLLINNARIALESLEAEPVAWRHFQETPTDGGYWIINDYKPNCSGVEPLYTAPPAPVSVPDAYVRDERGRMMLNGRQEPRIGYGAGWNGYRAAMLQGADGKPELTVSYGPMPESNGKTNWTAILHRKGEGMLDGITIDRSEYPGRVLYAADRARYLIGEKPDRPFILEYDADKHSGYVAPGKAGGNSPVIQDGWIPVSDHSMLPPLEYLDTVKFNADCAIQDPESIYTNEFFLSLDEVFGEMGNYSEPVQAKAVSMLIAEIFMLRGYSPAEPQQE